VIKAIKNKVMTTVEKEWFLSLPKEIKLQLIGDMLKEDQAMMALGAAKILLDAPISEGGVSTDEIKEVMDSRIGKDNI
jgi:hypothetical protein